MATMMVVDDEAAIRDMLRAHLTLAGHTCLVAENAQQARQLLLEQAPDIALLDVMMPGEDGFSLAGAFVQRGVPVLFLTAKTAVEDRVKGLRLGAEDYILKPFEPTELHGASLTLRSTPGKGTTATFDGVSATAAPATAIKTVL